MVEICHSKIIEEIFFLWIVINGCKIGDWMKKFDFHYPSLFNNGSSIGLVCVFCIDIQYKQSNVEHKTSSRLYVD